jgi:ubiquinone/menaquinone biosynthesis C-methylase UbiE
MKRFRFGALVVAVVVLGLALAGVRASSQVDQWHLDIDRAMEVVGVGPGMIVGEAGAGDGYFTLPMARRVGTAGAAGAVYANDIDASSLRKLAESAARDSLANVHTVTGTVDDPVFPRRDLQVIVVVHAFHDFSKPVEWLVNAKRYLRPGGTIAIIDRDPEQESPSHFWPASKILGYANSAGYETVRKVDCPTGHLIVVVRPKA